MSKSLCVSYFLWLVGGFFGLHHIYLRRYKHAFVWLCLPGGYFGAGWLRDFWRLPEYVRDANNDPRYIREITEQMKKHDRPPFSLVRCTGQLVLGNTFALLAYIAIPNRVDFGYDLEWLAPFIQPAACALGIWTVGNIGRQTGSILPPLIACYAAVPILMMGWGNTALMTLSGIAAFNWRSRRWRKKIRDPLPFAKAVLILFLCFTIYMSLWVSYFFFNLRIVTKEGDEIPLRDAIGNFVKSPAFQEFTDNLKKLWSHAWKHGFWSTITQLIDSLDPLGEKNALKVLGLKKGASQEEIKARYRELTKVWHPDKIQDPEKKEEGQARFMEIQQAYERLSEIKMQRSRQSSSATAG